MRTLLKQSVEEHDALSHVEKYKIHALTYACIRA